MHTPGPWTYDKAATLDSYYCVIGNHEGTYFKTGCTVARVEESEDAALIAAAPDLLGALTALVEAIAAADGHTIATGRPPTAERRAAIIGAEVAARHAIAKATGD